MSVFKTMQDAVHTIRSDGNLIVGPEIEHNTRLGIVGAISSYFLSARPAQSAETLEKNPSLSKLGM